MAYNCWAGSGTTPDTGLRISSDLRSDKKVPQGNFFRSYTISRAADLLVHTADLLSTIYMYIYTMYVENHIHFTTECSYRTSAGPVCYWYRYSCSLMSSQYSRTFLAQK